jgi:hypothetical protein
MASSWGHDNSLRSSPPRRHIHMRLRRRGKDIALNLHTNLTLRSGPQGRVSKGRHQSRRYEAASSTISCVAHPSRRPLRGLLRMRLFTGMLSKLAPMRGWDPLRSNGEASVEYSNVVILSEAKACPERRRRDLMPVASGDEVLRSAQDDRTHLEIRSGG